MGFNFNRDSFWERVVIELNNRKISQAKLANQIDISYGRLRNWIYKSYIPDAYTACEIAETLGVTVEYLVKGSA